MPKEELAQPIQPLPEYPDADQIRAYWALSFLYMRAEKYDMLSYRSIRRLIQPPIDLRQVRILDVEGVPRAAPTFAFLSDAAEQKLIAGDMIRPRNGVADPNYG